MLYFCLYGRQYVIKKYPWRYQALGLTCSWFSPPFFIGENIYRNNLPDASSSILCPPSAGSCCSLVCSESHSAPGSPPLLWPPALSNTSLLITDLSHNLQMLEKTIPHLHLSPSAIWTTVIIIIIITIVIITIFFFILLLLLRVYTTPCNLPDVSSTTSSGIV